MKEAIAGWGFSRLAGCLEVFSEVDDYFIGNPAVGDAACWQLLRHDESGDRAAGAGRGVLFHRELSLDDVGVRRRRTAQKHARRCAGFSRVRARSSQVSVLSPKRCAGGVRADLAADDAHADGAARALPQLQGQTGQGSLPEPRAVRLPGIDGGGYFNLRLQRCAGRPRPKTARRGDARHRDQVQPGLRRDLCHSRAEDSRLGGGGARHGRPKNEQELQQHDRHFRRRKGATQNHHAPRDGQPTAAGTQAGC